LGKLQANRLAAVAFFVCITATNKKELQQMASSFLQIKRKYHVRYTSKNI